MADMPQVSPGQWISIGGKEQHHRIPAVVCGHYDGLSADGGNIEVVYLDRNRAINTDVKWVGTHWEFAIAGPSGGYADNNPSLWSYVAILRRGRWASGT